MEFISTIKSIILRVDINTLDTCLVTEIYSRNEKCFVTCIYCLPIKIGMSWTISSDFDMILNNINVELPLCLIITGDFNVFCTRGWENDITK